MIIVWRGWGILVPVFLAIAFVTAAEIAGPLHGLTPVIAGLIFGATAVVAGMAIGIASQALESRPGRKLIDARTGRALRVGNSAGSFFFIPTRYWAFLSVVLGLGLGIAIAKSWSF